MNSMKGFISELISVWLVNKMNCVGKSHYQIISLILDRFLSFSLHLPIFPPLSMSERNAENAGGETENDKE